MRVFYASDIHYEFDGIYVPPEDITNDDVIILAGDVCPVLVWDSEKYSIDDLFFSLSEIARGVIFVAGNHEFYGTSIEDGYKFLRQRFAEYPDNIYFLENQTVTINGVRFGGSTFWTDLKQNDPLINFEAIRYLSDFSVIKNFTPEDFINLNRTAREWLVSVCNNIDVLVTHHLPVPVEYKNEPINSITYMYCNTNLENIIVESSIKYWIHGHSHQSYNFTIDKTNVVSNPYGYYSIPHDRNEEYTNDRHFSIV